MSIFRAFMIMDISHIYSNNEEIRIMNDAIHLATFFKSVTADNERLLTFD